MNIVTHPDLMERAVFETARSDPLLAAHYERQFADCYRHRDAVRRDAAFQALHRRWFEELGYAKRLAELLSEFPMLRERVSRVAVVPAPAAGLQSSELFGAPGRYTVALAVHPSALRDRDTLFAWARHELQHVEDLLDPAFEYDPAKRPEGTTPAARNLARDRYAVLWAMSIDARLERRAAESTAASPASAAAKRLDEFVRAFARVGDPGAKQRFDALWSRFGESRPTHSELLELATRGLDPQHPSDAVRPPSAGDPCPLCTFRTFDWATSESLAAAAVAIRRDFPRWSVALGACARCAEVYRDACRNDESRVDRQSLVA